MQQYVLVSFIGLGCEGLWITTEDKLDTWLSGFGDEPVTVKVPQGVHSFPNWVALEDAGYIQLYVITEDTYFLLNRVFTHDEHFGDFPEITSDATDAGFPTPCSFCNGYFPDEEMCGSTCCGCRDYLHAMA